MNPIINPMWIYLINLLCDLEFALFLFMILMAFGFGMYAFDLEFNPSWKIIKCWIVAFVMSMLLTIVIPSEKTMYTMMAANYVTEDNIKLSGDTVTGAVDYIFEKVDMLLEDDNA